MIFVHRLREDYSMNYFNSKRFRKRNENGWGVFWIMVSRSLVVSLHFNKNLSFWGFLYICWNVQIFVHRLCKDYSMNYFNSKRFRNKNENPRGVFWIMVSRSLVISLHFNEHLSISGFLFYFWKFIKINENRLYERAWTFFSKVIQKLLIFGAGFGSFLNVSKHFNKSANFLIIRDRYNPFNAQIF